MGIYKRHVARRYYLNTNGFLTSPYKHSWKRPHWSNLICAIRNHPKAPAGWAASIPIVDEWHRCSHSFLLIKTTEAFLKSIFIPGILINSVVTGSYWQRCYRYKRQTYSIECRGHVASLCTWLTIDFPLSLLWKSCPSANQNIETFQRRHHN